MAYFRSRLTAAATALGVAGIALVSAALLLRRHVAEPAQPTAESRALALGWGDFATTTLDAAPLNGDHTLSVRFMAEYDASYRGVIVADSSGSYHLGMAPYASLGRPALELCVGGACFTYPLPDAVLTDNDFRAGPPPQPPRRWRQLAISRRRSTIVVAYDGNLVGSFEVGALAAAGRLQLGRLAQPLFGVQDQFYGLIDDLRLWTLGLDDAELTRLTSGSSHGARSSSPPPHAAIDFDDSGVTSLSLRGSARLAPVSREHRAALDQTHLPPPQHQTRLELPFSAGQVWMPIQGSNSALSHHDIAAFAIDFIRVDPRFVSDNPGRVPGGSHHASQDQPVLAPARGQVVSLMDERGDDERSPAGDALSNFVCVQHRAGEVSCLLHLRKGAAARESASVEPGAVLARVGQSGTATVHLHFALSNLPETKAPDVDSKLVTIPAAFSDYFASTDFGQSWHHVERGVPAPGEWVRRGLQ